MLIKIDRETWIDPSWVVLMEFDTRSYANSMGATTLVLHLHDGTERRIKHEAQYLGGTDVFKVQSEILKAHETTVAK